MRKIMQWKKITACLLILFMMVQIISPIGAVFAALTYASSGAVTLHSNSSGAVDPNGHTQIWFEIAEDTKPSAWSEMFAVSGEGSVKVNGTDVSAILNGGGGEPAYLLVLSGVTLNVNDIVTIQGKFKTADDSYGINMFKAAFKYMGLNQWTNKGYWEQVDATTYETSGAVTLHSNSSGAVDPNGHTQIWFEIAEDTKPSVWSELLVVSGEGSVKVNGTEVSAILNGGGGEPAYLLVLSGVTLNQNDIVTIEGKFKTADNSYGLNIVKAAFKYMGLNQWTNKGYWEQIDALSYEDSGELTLHMNSTSGVDSNGHTQIWFEIAEDTKPSAWTELVAVSGEGSVKVNGSDVSFTLNGGGSEPAYLLVLSSVTLNANDIVTIQGKFKTVDDTYGINFVETSFEYKGLHAETNKGYWGSVTESINYINSGALSLHMNSTGGADSNGYTQVWFEIAEDTKPSAWSELFAVSGEGSVKVNGTEVSAILNGGGSEPAYLLVLSDVTLRANDIVTIQGKFKTVDNVYGINIAETSFKYLGLHNVTQQGYWGMVSEKVCIDSGKISLHENSTAANDPNGHSQVWLATEETKKPTNWVELSAVSKKGSVTINGKEVGVTLYGGGAEPAYLLIINGATLKAGDVLTIKGKFATADDSFEMNFAETSFEYKGLHVVTGKGYWGNVTEPITYANSGALSLHMNSTGGADPNGHKQIWFEIANNTKPSTWTELTPVVGEGSVKLNGKDISVILRGGGNEPAWLLELYDITLKMDDVITIEGKFATADQSYGLNVAKTSFVYMGLHSTQGKGYWQKETKITYTEMEIDKFYGDVSEYKDNGEGWHFYLGFKDAKSGIKQDSPLTGFKYKINDGEEKYLTSFYASFEKGSLFFYIPELEKKLTKNTTLTISGKAKGTTEAGGEEGIQLRNSVTLYGNEYGWSLTGFPKAPTYTSFEAKSVNKATSYNSTYNMWHVYLDPSAKLPGAKDSAFQGLEIEIDGKTYPVTVFHATHEDTLFFAIEGDKLPKDCKNGTKVVLKAGKAHQNGTNLALNLKKDVVLYKFFEGLTLKKPSENIKYTDISITKMNRATKFDMTSKSWYLQLQTNDEIPGEDWLTFYDLKVTLNGKQETVKVTNQGGTLYLRFGEDILPSTAKIGTLTIKSGAKAIGGDGEVGIKFVNDFEVYLFNGVWSEEEFKEVNEVERDCIKFYYGAHTKGSTLWGFYFRLNGEFPGISWYNKFDKYQVELNGRKIAVELNKADYNNSMYFPLDETIVGTFKEGDILKINKGSVAEDGGYKLTITNDFTLVYTGEKWMEYRDTDVQAPNAQNLWDVARYDSQYIPLSEDGTVLTSDQDKYCAITSSEKMMDYTVSFSGKKIYNDIGTPSFYLILRGNPMSENEPISRELCYGYVVTLAGYEITEQNMPNNPELWGTRSGYIYVWKNGVNEILQDQYLMGMEHNMNNDPFFKVDETYNYEVSIYNITETSVCIEFKVNGEVVYKCYDDASSEPMDPAVNAGTFGLYPMASSYIGGEVVELGNVIAEAEECLVSERIRVSATYPSILEGAVFTVDKEGATIEDGIFSATVPGTYTISATYNGKELTPLTIKVNDYADEDVDGETDGMNFWVVGITIVTVILAGGLTTFVLLKKKRKQKGNLEA